MIVRSVEQVDIATAKAYAQDLRGLLEETDFTERKAFLRSFIKRIEINKKQVTIRYFVQRSRSTILCYFNGTSKLWRI